MKVSKRRPDEARPPSPPAGNLRAVKHGVFSARLVSDDVDRLVERLFDQNPHLIPQDEFAVRGYAIAEVCAVRLAAYLERNGEFDARGRVRPAVDLLRRYLERAERARARLGLDPVARMFLRTDEVVLVQRLRALFDVEDTCNVSDQASSQRG